ncbi:MAG: hypothetical protein A3H57_00395 [Candidatus Taylorbacteria bacterium RIFCSPLOWO2_02_FULL_43_11]|uniref:Glycosyl transferase n=1 Tax=Candidatus Taylorbacteria bacterium RIFCSPHIGHO2_02_FULL_43_32b TaxID=1802306 RepID=A0A1G2MEG3_9BACT|nr:MAG: hypothetical protein A2743_04320 [Candidatus Taylorbacteria bacterium RIFCSPHIGHO2_01_FULL_43_47]OHA22286.1 MAG: hypothetical protein A3C72_04275 [Candidatus Taylorbacteria bacterium RIFCSPHIGHO2_02_FULL_43_32b]OHA29333.1 MAG: hypothetical protein A3B08_04180 [Candidatus Taylorbacteria bacterium RIFCSPLOWO2_01_FULL_43_44]OHA36453.1 MAG: hypothetical protein A3H57_00395 [Candidatus Taylorbacteria bacterium RIFCSPLOWO2_02_FULL_43_11]
MKIAQIAPLIERVPPKKYGGTERVVSALTEELVKRGHEVTLFASGDSLTQAKLYSIFPRSLSEIKMKDLFGLNPWTLLNIGMAYQMQDQFDIIHDHCSPACLPTANIAKTPVIVTMHGPFTPENKKLYQSLKKPNVVTISKEQFSVSDINHAGTVYNGLPMEHYPFGKTPGKYLLFVGRISMEKGVHFAIEAAEVLDLPLIIAAKLETVDVPYFREYVEPRLSEHIRWVGQVDESERNKLMSEALCFLHPVTWREPFGLTMIEAMACGCPVIAFNLGSIPEVVKNGETGFVVSSIDGMIDAILNIDSIDRETCRKHALLNFNARIMTDGYEAIYTKILSDSEKKS